MDLRLDIGWGHPSPIQTYFMRSKDKNPFRMISTANYRGHVAEWTLRNDSLILNKINAHLESTNPTDYSIISPETKDGKYFASWFNGVIEAYDLDNEKKFYWLIEEGNVIKSSTDTSIDEMSELYERYMTFFFRLGDDVIIYENSEALLSAGWERLPPIFTLYKTPPYDWPYNWKNDSLSGAPKTYWSIKDSVLYVDKIVLQYGLRFDTIYTKEIELPDVIRNDQTKQKKANWVNGLFFLKFGKEEANDWGYKEFIISHYRIIRVSNGDVIQNFEIDKKFNFEKPPRKTDPELLKMIDEYFKSP